MNLSKSLALYTNAQKVPSEEEQHIPSYAWEEKEHMHLGLPIGGKNTEERAKQTALERVRAKLKLVGPTRLPALEKAKLLNSTVAGTLQFYAQTVAFDEKEATEINEMINDGFWGPRAKEKKLKYIKKERLTMPIQHGGVGLIDVSTWLMAFRRNQLVRLHRATERPEDEILTVYTDTVLPSIFNHMVNFIRCKLDMSFPVCGSYFWLEKSVRITIANMFPLYWRFVLEHFESKLGHKHNMSQAIHPSSMPLDTIFSAEITVPGPLDQYITDRELQKRFSKLPDEADDWYKTQFGVIYDENDNGKWCVGPEEYQVNETIRAILNKSTPEQRDQALTLVLLKPWYLMPLKLEAPRTTKGGTKFHYQRFKEQEAGEKTNSNTPEGEWAIEAPALATEAGRIKQEVRENVVRAFRGGISPMQKTHAWHLWQGRLAPSYWNCVWCKKVGKVKGSTLTNRDHYRHQAWECSQFQLHWNRLRRRVGLPKTSGLTEIVFGLSQDGKTKVKRNVQKKMLALHTAMWEERKQVSEMLYYDKVVSQYNRIVKTHKRKPKFPGPNFATAAERRSENIEGLTEIEQKK
jgi:hypothetical protein